MCRRITDRYVRVYCEVCDTGPRRIQGKGPANAALRIQADSARTAVSPGLTDPEAGAHKIAAFPVFALPEAAVTLLQ